jgi:riboflavin biosynthesis pyrimidine reductase
MVKQLFPAAAEVELSPDDAYAYPADRTFLRANMVSSVDGAAVGPRGRSGDLSEPADQRLLGVLRRLADVILVGARTARVEGYGPARRPIAVVSASLDFDPSAPLFAGADQRTIVLTSSDAPPERVAALAEGSDVVVCGEHSVDATLAIDALASRGYRKLLCEGGPTLLRQLVAAGVVDELCLSLSPLMVGGGPGRILAGDPLIPPLHARLTHLFEEDGTLFSRYTLSGT